MYPIVTLITLEQEVIGYTRLCELSMRLFKDTKLDITAYLDPEKHRI